MALIIASCSGGEKKAPAAEPARADTPPPAREEYFYVNTKEDINLGSVSIGKDVVIDIGGIRTTGQWDGKRRIYYGPDNNEVFRVKADEGGMKLLVNEELKVKVKWDYPDGKIKIAYNEEMTDSYEIKPKEGNRFKIDHKDSELLDYHLTGNNQVEVLADTYKIGGFGLSKGAGVLLLEGMEMREKLAVVAELTLAGK